MAAIDVILPFKNGIQFLGEAINSVQPANICRLAVACSDHESSDGSLECVQKYAEALERELEFRWYLATTNSGRMASRYIKFQFNHGMVASERRTVRNWLLRKFRNGKYLYGRQID